MKPNDYKTDVAESKTDTTVYNLLSATNDYSLYQKIVFYGNIIEFMECYVVKGSDFHKPLGWRTWHRVSEALDEWQDYVAEREERNS